MSKSFKYIDIHGHVNFPDFDTDRGVVIERAFGSGVAMINVGTDIETSTSAVQLATSHEHMWATVGIHPTEEIQDSKLQIQGLGSDSIFENLEHLARHPKVVAIGECGLDYFHLKNNHGGTESAREISSQKQIFEKHIILAQKVGKPLMLHVRNGKLSGSVSKFGNAYVDALNLLKKYPDVKANFHFFAGTASDLEEILSRGYSVSFTGVITFTGDYDELIKMAPISQIMSETDCPFVAPAPHRGKRNEPVFVIDTVKAIARIRGGEEVVVAGKLIENAKNFFGL